MNIKNIKIESEIKFLERGYEFRFVTPFFFEKIIVFIYYDNAQYN